MGESSSMLGFKSGTNKKTGKSVFHFDDKYETMSFKESLNLKKLNLSDAHAAHCCIYSQKDYSKYISMQMRFDGLLGMPGGIVDGPTEREIVKGLNRELVEEMNLDEKYFVTEDNHFLTYFHKEQRRCFHFFAKEVSVEDFKEIEKNSLYARDYGTEVLGVIRVPLYTMWENKGFPAFLSHSFAGCAKQQLLDFLVHIKWKSYDEIKKCLSYSVAKI